MQFKYSQTQKRSKDIGQTLHVTSLAQLKFCKLQEYFLCAKTNKSNDFIQQFFSPNLPSSSIL